MCQAKGTATGTCPLPGVQVPANAVMTTSRQKARGILTTTVIITDRNPVNGTPGGVS